jgi:hypothetical protein
MLEAFRTLSRILEGLEFGAERSARGQVKSIEALLLYMTTTGAAAAWAAMPPSLGAG